MTLKALIRIGPKTTENHRPRPLKVVFAGPDDPRRLLVRAHKLRGGNVAMRPDLSPEERSKLRDATIELKARKENGEQGLTIVNFRVVRRLRLLTKPLVMTSRT